MESILERGTISTSCKNTFHSHHNNNNNIKTYSGSLLQNWWVSSTGTILDHLCKSMFYYILPQFMILSSDMSSPRNRKPRALYFINRTFCLLFICPMQHYHIHLFEHYQLCLFALCTTFSVVLGKYGSIIGYCQKFFLQSSPKKQETSFINVD